MRHALSAQLLIAAALFAGCSPPPSFEPALLTETRGLDREVLDLVEAKVALVRAAPSDARAHATLALAYEANGLWDAADKSYAHALAIETDEPLWLYHRALVLREAGQPAEALALLRRAGAAAPAEAAVQQRLGHWLLDVGKLDEARAAFERALAAAPDRPESLTGLAATELARERWNEALALARRANKVDPFYRPARFAAGQALQALGRTDEARDFLATGADSRVRWLDDALTRERTGYRLTTTALVEDASEAAGTGNRSRAVELYERLVQRKPDDPDLLNNLAASLLELERLDRAEEVLRRAAALAPDSFAVELNLTDLEIRRGKPDAARPHADRAVELGASVGRTHLARARVLAMQKDVEGAQRELESALALDARDPQTYLGLAEVGVMRGRLEDARRWCRKALELDPGLLPARVNLGMLALRAGDLDEARAALALLEKQAPQHPRTAALREQLSKLERP